jgi:hypothetical protein
MTPLAPLVSVHQLPIIFHDGVSSVVELRFTVADDFTEEGYRCWSLQLPAESAKQLACRLMAVGYAIEPEDDRV